jgi:hypothetical protein
MVTATAGLARSARSRSAGVRIPSGGHRMKVAMTSS